MRIGLNLGNSILFQYFAHCIDRYFDAFSLIFLPNLSSQGKMHHLFKLKVREVCLYCSVK